MSKNPNTKQDSPNQPPADPFGPRIPVAVLYFDRDRQMPGGRVGSTLEATNGPSNRKSWKVDYLPKMGFFEVRFTDANKTDSDIRYVPRDWCSWTPAR